MNLHNILLTIQLVSIMGLFIEIWVVLIRWRTRLHSYLLFSSIAAFINNTGYLLEITAPSEDSFITALPRARSLSLFLMM